MSSTATKTSSELRPAIRTRWLALGVMLGLAIMATGCYYYWVQWRENRFDEYYRLHAYYKVKNGFINDLRQGHLETAYLGTSPTFRARVSRDEFEERVRAYMEFHAKPDAKSVGGTPFGLVEPGYRGNQILTDTYTMQDAEGNRQKVSTTVVINDSIFYRRPPAPLVDDFSVSFLPVASEQQ